ncbi:MAG TPA: FixH family protein [Aestuariivirgaceae bacterium]|nr:FixH family protein [Aestuariivirgaceae bacterium]
MERKLAGIALFWLAVAVAMPAMTVPAEAQRLDAAVACDPTGNHLEYRCEINLFEAQSSEPVEDAEFVVRADMPSMPMTHNVPPASVRALDAPGLYEAVFELEMHGEWALRLEISAPRRDIVVVTQEFGAAEHGEDHGEDHGHESEH